MADRRSYIDWEHGQLHIRQWGKANQDKPSLFCLAPSPYSSVAYKTLAPLLADSFHVISMDYPGFGGSSPMPTWPTISDYAKAAFSVAEHLSPDKPVAFLGFHSGTLVAIEMALCAMHRVAQLILVDIPYFDEETRLAELEKKSADIPIVSNIAMLEPAWKLCVLSKEGEIALPRAYENFVDMIGSGDRLNATYRAAFAYDCHGALPKVQVPTSLIATEADLFAETAKAADIIPNARLYPLPEITIAVLDKGAIKLAQTIDNILN